MSTNTANTLVAGVEVKVAGAMLDPKLQDRLVEVRVEDNLTLPDTFELRISDPDLTVVDTSPFEVGAPVTISFAGKAANALKPVLEGEVTSLEPEFGKDAVLVVRGYDLSHRLGRKRTVRTFQQVTYADAAKKVITENGLGAGKVDSAGGVHPFIQQNNQTDWEFLWHLARRIDFEVVVEGRKCHFRKASTKVPGPTLTWGDTLRSFRPRVTGVQQVSQVEVGGWDPKSKQKIVGLASVAERSAKIGMVVDGLAQKLSGGLMKLANVPVDSQGDATELAKSVLARLANSSIEATGVAEGDPDLRAGTTVKVDGVGTKFGGEYKLTSTTHLYRTASGYETRFTIGGRSPRNLVDLMNRSRPKSFGNSVVVGIVTNTNDPEQLGRVRVKFPELSDQDESFWARVVVPNAGKQRGIYMMPQVGDEVVVAFLHDQPEYPYILGSVFNGKDTPGPDLAKQDGSYGVRSPKDIVSDAKEKVLFTCKDFTVETTQHIVHKATGDHTITAQGKNAQKSTGPTEVEGMTVKVKGSASVTVEAGASLTLKGATIDISASGPVNIKGALINIG